MQSALSGRPVNRCAAPRGAGAQNASANLWENSLEILLQIWDEMDDWLAACRQALERNLR